MFDVISVFYFDMCCVCDLLKLIKCCVGVLSLGAQPFLYINLHVRILETLFWHPVGACLNS
jgi:hypothetical protein